MAWHGGGRAGEALLLPTRGFRGARCRSPWSASRPMLRGMARRRCPQEAAVSRAEASAASAAGWAQTPPGAPKLRGNQLPLPCFQVLLNDERDQNETEAQPLKLFVFTVHSLVDVVNLRKVHLVSNITAVWIRSPLLSYRLFLAWRPPAFFPDSRLSSLSPLRCAGLSTESDKELALRQPGEFLVPASCL